MKLKVGMYVRTNDGYINKIKKVNQFNVLVYGRDLFGEELNIPNNEITKASYNIIDILEENDYINGVRIEKNKYGELYISYVYYGGDIGKKYEIYTNWLKELKEDMIYNIVTQEKMKQKAYKVVINNAFTQKYRR